MKLSDIKEKLEEKDLKGVDKKALKKSIAQKESSKTIEK